MIKKFELLFDATKKNKKIDFNILSSDILYFYFKKKIKNIIKKKHYIFSFIFLIEIKLKKLRVIRKQ
jgi:hypothetical protein